MSTSHLRHWIGVVIPQFFLGACILVLAVVIVFQGKSAAVASADDGAQSAHAGATEHATPPASSASPEHGSAAGNAAKAEQEPGEAREATHEQAPPEEHGTTTERPATGGHGTKAEGGKDQSRELLKRLIDGNRGFVADSLKHPNQQPERRVAISKEQKPFAIVLACSDSRVPPEVIFDQGLGDLFVVRIAGNSVDPAVLGSVEYAVEHLNAALIVVLGHERCGAVKAAIAGGSPPGHLKAVLDPIMPAVKAAKGKGDDLAEQTMRAHTLNMVKQLKESKPVLAELVYEGRVTVVGARYDLDTGKVEILE
jgi:carbonic anhydrase